MTWQVHVYGTASAELVSWCRQSNLPLHVFGWRSEFLTAGFAPESLYLLRPDTYVALATSSSAVDVLQHYLDERGIQIEPFGARIDSSSEKREAS